MVEIVNSGDARSIKLWDEKLFRDWPKQSFFGSRFLSEKGDNLVKVQMDLTKKRGESITVGIRVRGGAGYLPSGEKVDKNERSLSSFTDVVPVDAKNFGIKTDDIMTEQRSFIDYRKELQPAAIEDQAEYMDLEFFKALDAANTTVAYPSALTGGFSLTSTLGTATAAVTAAGKLSPELLTYIKPGLITGFNRKQPPIQPVLSEGGMKWFIVLVHPDVLADLENDPTFIQGRQVALEKGKTNPLFTGAWAAWNGFIIYAHENVGIGTNASSVPYAKCHILGMNSLVLAWAKKPVLENKNVAYKNEEMAVGSFSTFGIKKTQFNSKDYGAVNLVVARTALSDKAYA